MRTLHIFLMSLLVVLSGCQPETPAQQAAAPAAVQPSVASAPAEQIAQPAVSEAVVAAPAQQVESSQAARVAQPAANKKILATEKDKVLQPTVVEEPAPAAPAPAVVAPAAKAEPAPTAETKPEVKPEPAVSEAEATQLAKKNNCFACHAIDKKVIGPAFRDVAAKYRGDSGAEARLSDKIAKGGSGVWGVMVMPPSPQVSETDRRILAKFVLSLK